MSMNTFILNYRIEKIEINSFVIDVSSYKENMSVFSNKGFEIACDDSAHIVKVKISFSLHCENEDNDFLHIEQTIYYGIHSEEYAKLIYQKEGMLYFNRFLLKRLKQEAYDSLRGSLFVKTENISFNKFYIPVWQVPLDEEDRKMEKIENASVDI